MDNYINEEICSECKGKCCKSMGCHFSPEDFTEISIEHLEEQIKKGYISIDWWEGPLDDDDMDDRTLFLRIRNVDSPIVDPSWGGRCILLTDKGCKLNYNERPKGARKLIPTKDKCIQQYKKDDCCADWKQYQNILNKLVDIFE